MIFLTVLSKLRQQKDFEYSVSVRESTLPGNPLIYHFGPSIPESRNLKLWNQPVVSFTRSVDTIWYDVFQKAGWQTRTDFNGRGTEQWILKHQMEPGSSIRNAGAWAGIVAGQYIAQIPGWEAFEKDQLVKASRQALALGHHGFDFAPAGFSVLRELDQLDAYFDAHPGKWMLQKPIGGSFGWGVKIIRSAAEVDVTKNTVVQEYVDDVALIDGHKFDLRVYTLITSIDPLVAYVYDDGYAKLATVKYEKPNEDNKAKLDLHLTNRGANDHNYVPGSCNISSKLDGFQRLNDSFMRLYETREQFHGDLYRGMSAAEFLEDMHTQLQSTMARMLAAVYPSVYRTAERHDGLIYRFPRPFYARHGADVILTRDGEFKVLEVNRRPFQATVCPSEFIVAPKVVRDELNLVGLRVNLDATKTRVINPTFERPLNDHQLAQTEFVEEEHIKARFGFQLGDIFDIEKLTQYERRVIAQLEDEATRLGGFRMIFPTTDPELQAALDDLQPTRLNQLAHAWRLAQKSMQQPEQNVLERREDVL